MSYSTDRKAARDPSRPLKHRASHARSCSNRVASRLDIDRDRLIETLKHLTGVDLRAPGSELDFVRAFDYQDVMGRCVSAAYDPADPVRSEPCRTPQPPTFEDRLGSPHPFDVFAEGTPGGDGF